MYKITPSLMTCNLLEIRKELVKMQQAGIDWIHVDFMDGKFVPNLGLVTNLLGAIKAEFPQLTIDAHCMVNDIKNVLNELMQADYITIHYSSLQPDSIMDTLTFLHQKGKKVGLAIDLTDDLQQIMPLLKMVDLVTIMSIKPGFAGQTFDDNTWIRIQQIIGYRKTNNLKYYVQIDGGVRWNNIQRLIAEKVDLIVVGSLLFKERNYQTVLTKISKLQSI